MKTWKIAGIALAVVIAASVVTGSLVFAQEDTPPPDANNQTEQAVPLRPLRPNQGFGDPGARRGGRQGRGGMANDAHHEALAEALGLTPEELQAELDAGKRLPEIAEELGIELTELEAALQAARVAQIEQAVADGVLTQEQADQILERMAEAAEIAKALDAMRTAEIEEALANGTITQEQADLLNELGGKGPSGFGRMPNAPMGNSGRGGQGEMGWRLRPNDN